MNPQDKRWATALETLLFFDRKSKVNCDSQGVFWFQTSNQRALIAAVSATIVKQKLKFRLWWNTEQFKSVHSQILGHFRMISAAMVQQTVPNLL